MDWSSGNSNNCSQFFSTYNTLFQEMGSSRAHNAEIRIEASGLLREMQEQKCFTKYVLLYNYSQTSVFEHNSFWKAVRKPICSKAESYFPVRNNKKEINLFYTPKK